MPTSSRGRPAIRPLVWVGLLILYTVWGSTYLGIAVAIETIPPFTMAAVRFFIAGALLLAWSIAREGRGFRFPTRRAWRCCSMAMRIKTTPPPARKRSNWARNARRK